MIKPEAIEEARAIIADRDIEALMRWYRKHMPIVNHDYRRNTFTRIFAAGDVEKGLIMFRVDVEHYNPVRDATVTIGRLFVKLVIAAGAIGGVVYLVQSCGGM